jgi:hypothetical protein
MPAGDPRRLTEPMTAADPRGQGERRQSTRRPLRTSATILVNEERLPARTVDISCQGLSIMIDRNLPPGTPCGVAFTLLDNGRFHPIRLTARVVHGLLSGRGSFKIGLQTTQLAADDENVIRHYLRL